MPGPKIKKLSSIRPVSRSQAHARVKNLKCYKAMYDRILQGWPLTEVAKYIQEVEKESTDISSSSLVMALSAFRADIPPAELTKRALPKAHVAAVAAMEEGIDEVHEMTKLYRRQMERIEIEFTLEKGMKKLMPTMTQEIRVAREILSSVADLKMSLGLSKRHLGQLDVDARVMTDIAIRYENQAPNVKQVMENPQSRLKILGMVEKLLTRSTARVVGDPTETALPEGAVIDAEGHSVEGTARTLESEHTDELFPEFEDDKPGDESP